MRYFAVIQRNTLAFLITSSELHALEMQLNLLPQEDLVLAIIKGEELNFKLIRSFMIEERDQSRPDPGTWNDSLLPEGESEEALLEMNDEEELASRLVENTSG